MGLILERENKMGFGIVGTHSIFWISSKILVRETFNLDDKPK